MSARTRRWGGGHSVSSLYVRCPECGYRTHRDASPRDDDRMTCAKCYHVFDPEDE